jgi:hypothetical protein
LTRAVIGRAEILQRSKLVPRGDMLSLFGRTERPSRAYGNLDWCAYLEEAAPMLDRNRREFITVLGCAAAWPLAARAQQPAMPVVGILSSSSLSAFIDLLGAFRQGLKETGYIEGRNITIESRWAEGRFERLPELAAELVQRRAAVIVTTGDSSTLATMLAVGVWSLYGIRALVGVAEAGFLPGILLYLTYWFPRTCRARANALFIMRIPATIAIDSTVSGFILQMNGFLGLAGWRWLFLLEGLPAVGSEISQVPTRSICA